MAKVTVDRKKCIMCNLCIDMVPEVFEEKGGKSAVKENVDLSNKEVLESVKMAVEACAVQAIKLDE